MNVLIVTPDAVGSTLLQRLTTIYMQFHAFDRPVINLHELTNGIEKYFSPDFNREIVSKSRVKQWGYHQTLQQVVELLASVDHYKTSRLAHYHIRRRGDSMADQIPFYKYLNDNFFVIAARRNNVFEQALSFSLNDITKKLNVYNPNEKCMAFLDLYENPIDLDTDAFVASLESYRTYLDWSENYFGISSYFIYENHIPAIENYILNLPIFNSFARKITWAETFGMTLDDWNRYHNLTGDIGAIALRSPQALQQIKASAQATLQDDVIAYQEHALPQWPAIETQKDFDDLPEPIKTAFQLLPKKKFAVSAHLTQEERQYLQHHRESYTKGRQTIQRMVDLDILVSAPPIKKQTLREKRHLIKNFDHCLDLYNDWVIDHPEVGVPISKENLQDQIIKELSHQQQLTAPTSALQLAPAVAQS